MAGAVARSYLLRRVGLSLIVLVAASVVIFVALRVIPGDPTEIRASRPGFSSEQLAALRVQLGLNESLPAQYLKWIGGVIQGDFGVSYFSDYSTTELIRKSLGPTLELAIVATVLGLLIAIPLAVLAAMKPGGLLDRALSVFTAAGLAVPPFLIGIVLIAIFAVQLGWLPTRGHVSFVDDPVEHLRTLAMPAVTMAIVLAAPVIRMLRASLLEELGADYVRTVRAKGIGWRRIVVHDALRNAFLPTLNLIGLTIGYLLGGVVVVEYVFSWPGLGSLAVQSVLNRDYAVLQGVVLLAAAGFILTSLAVDLLQRVLDPRLKLGGS